VLILKRLAVWLLESLPEAFLLGGLLLALSLLGDGTLSLSNFVHLLPGAWALAFGVASVLFLHGYYLTTGLFGAVWRSGRIWVYPAIAAILFDIHTHIVFVRLKPDMSAPGRATEVSFLVIGACMVFGCRFVGGWFLRHWTRVNREL
jgi:hypothetical protein